MVYFFFEVTPVFFNYLNSDGIGESLFAREGEKKRPRIFFDTQDLVRRSLKTATSILKKKKIEIKREGDEK